MKEKEKIKGGKSLAVDNMDLYVNCVLLHGEMHGAVLKLRLWRRQLHNCQFLTVKDPPFYVV